MLLPYSLDRISYPQYRITPKTGVKVKNTSTIEDAINKAELLSLCEQGHTPEVVAHKDASRTSSVWYGNWTLQIAGADGQPVKKLVSARSSGGPQLRRFKTANGLISFLSELGLEEVSVPLKANTTARLSAADDPEPVAEPERQTALDIQDDSPLENVQEPPPMAAYITMTNVGRALRLLDLRGLLSVADARLLARIGLVKPDFVRVAAPDDTPYLFEFVSFSAEGSRQRTVMNERIRPDDWLWGCCRNVLDNVEGHYGSPSGQQIVYSRALVALLAPDSIEKRHAGSALGWSGITPSDEGIEEVFLPPDDGKTYFLQDVLG